MDLLTRDNCWAELESRDQAALERAYRSYGLDLGNMLKQARRRLVQEKVGGYTGDSSLDQKSVELCMVRMRVRAWVRS